MGGSYLPSNNPASLVGWFRKGVGITITGAGVAVWADQSGNGHDLLQGTDTNRPAYDGSAIITFDGVDNFLKCVGFAWIQPHTVAALIKPVAYSGKYWWDGNTLDKGGMFNSAGSTMTMYSGSNGPAAAMVAGAFYVVSALYSGAASSLKVDNAAPVTGNPNTGNPAGFTLGANGTPGGYGSVAVKEIILRNVDDAAIRAADHAYLQTL